MMKNKFQQVVIFAFICVCCSQTLSPIKVHFVEGNKELFFYGSAHDNNIANPMFADIEESFKRFTPDVVLIEGGYSNRSYSTKEQAIGDGEMAFVSFLGSSASIPMFDIEPSGMFVDSILLSQFSSNLIFTMYILRQTFQYQSKAQNNDIDFIKEIENYANYIIANGRFDFEDSLKFEDIFRTVESETDIAITRENWFDKRIEVRRYLYNRRNVVKNQVQIVHSRVVDIRDEYATSLIMDKLEEYNKVFVIMGNQHLLNQENILREELRNRFRFQNP
ncbi:MAG: hypothetical protein EA361_15175 [Bacteroidetes bacterium]|nr:MAG: hypothetical protein EA361_15175 [Bacteroidota bacterium]